MSDGKHHRRRLARCLARRLPCHRLVRRLLHHRRCPLVERGVLDTAFAHPRQQPALRAPINLNRYNCSTRLNHHRCHIFGDGSLLARLNGRYNARREPNKGLNYIVFPIVLSVFLNEVKGYIYPLQKVCNILTTHAEVALKYLWLLPWLRNRARRRRSAMTSSC